MLADVDAREFAAARRVLDPGLSDREQGAASFAISNGSFRRTGEGLTSKRSCSGIGGSGWSCAFFGGGGVRGRDVREVRCAAFEVVGDGRDLVSEEARVLESGDEFRVGDLAGCGAVDSVPRDLLIHELTEEHRDGALARGCAEVAPDVVRDLDAGLVVARRRCARVRIRSCGAAA